MYNRFMRIIVMFDLPTATTEDKREYLHFRTGLIKLGFDMLQYSVYSRITRNNDDARKYINKVKAILPPVGSVRILQVTEKQYAGMIIMLGEKTPTENLLTTEDLIEL